MPGKTDRALRFLDLAIERDPQKGEAYFHKGIILVNQKRMTEAEQVMKQGLKVSPDSPSGHYYLGRIYGESGNVEQAVASYERAIAVNAQFEPAYLAEASLYESRQEKEKAIGVLKRYLDRVNPNNKDIRQRMVQLYVSTKDYAGALAELEKMLAEDPGDLDAQLRMALIYGEKVGDQVTVQYLESLVLELKKGSDAVVGRTEKAGGARAPEGGAPGGVVGRQVKVVGEVTAADAAAQTVTVRGPKQTVDMKIADPEQFKRVAVGDKIEPTYTQAAAIDVKPVAAK